MGSVSREPELGVDVAATEVAAEEGSGLVPLFTDLRGNCNSKFWVPVRQNQARSMRIMN